MPKKLSEEERKERDIKKREYHRNYYKTHREIEATKDEVIKHTRTIVDYYVNKEYSTYKIGKLFKIDKSAINRILVDNGVILRSNKISHLLTAKDKNSKWKGCEEITGSYWRSVIFGATKARNLEFSIDIIFAWDLYVQQNRKCALTGLDIIFAQLNKDLVAGKQTASLDRKDSSKGYTKDNVWWVHKKVNIMKQSFSVEEFCYYCKLVAKNIG
jgi:hypothetical protein